MSTSDDSEFIDRAQAGDHRAFAALIQRYDPMMRGLAFRMLGTRAAMDDALQDAYLKAYKSIERFDGTAAFSTWLYTITQRTCLDHIRALKRRPVSPLDQMGEQAAPGADVGDRMADHEQLQTAILQIPEDQAAAVLLVDGEGFSYLEAAEFLSVAPGTVASRLNRGRTSLRALLVSGGQG